MDNLVSLYITEGKNKELIYSKTINFVPRTGDKINLDSELFQNNHKILLSNTAEVEEILINFGKDGNPGNINVYAHVK